MSTKNTTPTLKQVGANGETFGRICRKTTPCVAAAANPASTGNVAMYLQAPLNVASEAAAAAAAYWSCCRTKSLRRDFVSASDDK